MTQPHEKSDFVIILAPISGNYHPLNGYSVSLHGDGLDGTEFLDRNLRGSTLVIDFAGTATVDLQDAAIDMASNRSRAHDAAGDISGHNLVGLDFTGSH